MKLIIVAALALVAVVVAAPPQAEDPKHVPQILKSDFNQDPNGAYNWGFETENGITRNEQGELKELTDEDNKPREVVVVKGSYTYTDSEGNPQTVSYYADETGFHAEGPSIPVVAPPAKH